MHHDKLSRLLPRRHGRIGRRRFVGALLAAAATFVVLFVFLDTMATRAATWILYPPLFWIAYSLASRRLHDTGRPAWWLCIAIVPLLGPLYLAWLLVFHKGSAGENQFGADPLEYGDYLTVDIHAPGPAR